MTKQAECVAVIRSLAGALDTLVFPRYCILCDAGCTRVGLCDACRDPMMDTTQQVCPTCATPLRAIGGNAAHPRCAACRQLNLGYDATLALGPYEGGLRSLCLRLKKRRFAWLAQPLVEMLLEARSRQLRSWLDAGDGREAVLVAVPLHWRRHWSRGYNQADALGRAFQRPLRLRRIEPVRRVRSTQKLATLSRAARVVALRGAFQAKPDAASAVKDRDVVLVDDILTTGATCSAVARILKSSGARRVLSLVIARAAGPGT